MSVELMGGELVDEKRQRQLESLAKARAVRAANREAGANLPVPAAPVKRPKKLKGKRAFNAAMAERKAAKVPTSEQMVGLNSINCGFHCTAEKCVITGENVCGHPNKGGLQAKYMQDKAVLSRFGEARLCLARQEAEAGKGRKF